MNDPRPGSTSHPLLCVLVAWAVAGCGGDSAEDRAARVRAQIAKLLPSTVRAALERPDRLQLYSLHPYPHLYDEPVIESEAFHGYKVIGQALVTEPSDREQLVEALYDGLSSSDGRVAACFHPRHGLRAVRGDHVVDLVICYECRQVDVVVDGKRTGHTTTSRPEHVFDAALRAFDLPQAPGLIPSEPTWVGPQNPIESLAATHRILGSNCPKSARRSMGHTPPTGGVHAVIRADPLGAKPDCERRVTVCLIVAIGGRPNRPIDGRTVVRPFEVTGAGRHIGDPPISIQRAARMGLYPLASEHAPEHAPARAMAPLPPGPYPPAHAPVAQPG